MPKKHHYRKDKSTPELDVTTFLNLMVVLVPFLLITAVFSRITIHELSMPSSAGPSQANKPKVTIEVIVRKRALEVSDGRRTVARFRNKDDNKYDIKKLSDYLLKLKKAYPDKTDAVILMEPDIEYDYLVTVMDAVKVVTVKKDGQADQKGEQEKEKVVLFPDISIGDAP